MHVGCTTFKLAVRVNLHLAARQATRSLRASTEKAKERKQECVPYEVGFVKSHFCDFVRQHLEESRDICCFGSLCKILVLCNDGLDWCCECGLVLCWVDIGFPELFVELWIRVSD